MVLSGELTPVRNAHRFDEAALERYLQAHVPDFRGPLHVRQFEGGQSNPTYLLDSAQHRYVLRRKPPGPLLPSAHQVEREYRVLTALAGTDVPVPRTVLLCQDDAVIGMATQIPCREQATDSLRFAMTGRHLDDQVTEPSGGALHQGGVERGHVARVLVSLVNVLFERCQIIPAQLLSEADQQLVHLGEFARRQVA